MTQDWLARTADAVIDPAIRIVLILVIAVVVRALAHRTIRRGGAWGR